jgi:hypothetical protein
MLTFHIYTVICIGARHEGRVFLFPAECSLIRGCLSAGFLCPFLVKKILRGECDMKTSVYRIKKQYYKYGGNNE